MKVIIYGKWPETEKLIQNTKKVFENLWLDKNLLEVTNDDNIQKELWIQKQPAFILYDGDIDFKDIFFEWEVPSENEIEMFLSNILWAWWDMFCAPSSCGSCAVSSVCENS